MDNFDYKKYLAEGRLLKEEQSDLDTIKMGSKFLDEEGDVWTVVDLKMPSRTDLFTPIEETPVEAIVLKDEDGVRTTFPDDFDGGGFFDWFNHV